MDAKELLTAKKVVGTKETLRMVEKRRCKVVFVAKDASEEVLRPLLTACEREKVAVETVDTMEHLGECCGIKVAAASAGIL